MPDFDVFKEKGFTSVLFAAMTQAFFTLSIGIGTMEIFGSYLKKDRTLVGESVNVIVLDTAVAVVAGLIIIPACFAYGIEPDSGPSLLFITLPNVFPPYGFKPFVGNILLHLHVICSAFHRYRSV